MSAGTMMLGAWALGLRLLARRFELAAAGKLDTRTLLDLVETTAPILIEVTRSVHRGATPAPERRLRLLKPTPITTKTRKSRGFKPHCEPKRHSAFGQQPDFAHLDVRSERHADELAPEEDHS